MSKEKCTKPLPDKAGTVWPHEYDWKSQFRKIDPADGFIKIDAGKVYGLAKAFADPLAKDKTQRPIVELVKWLQEQIEREKEDREDAGHNTVLSGMIDGAIEAYERVKNHILGVED